MNVKKYLENPSHIFYFLKRKGLLENWSDEKYLKLMYKAYTGRKLNLEKPGAYTEKLQWLKIHDHKDIYTTMVDKYEAKKYVENKLGGAEYIIPTLGVWEHFDDIDFDTLPSQFVLKCTHDSAGLVICRDKSKLDYEKAKNKIESCLKRNFFTYGREWPYKNVKPRIIAEKYMEEPGSKTGCLTDYKIFCFDGVPKAIMTVEGGHDDENGIVRRMYDPNWELLNVGLHGKPPVKESEKAPEKLQEMLEIARKLSAGFKHLRVDLQEIDGKVYFGELTFYHMSGYEIFTPYEFDLYLGSLLNL